MKFFKAPETKYQIYLTGICTLMFYVSAFYGVIFKNTTTPWFWFTLAGLFSVALIIDIWQYKRR